MQYTIKLVLLFCFPGRSWWYNRPLASVPWIEIQEGDTQEGALPQAKEAIQLWVETAREGGDAVPEPKGRGLMFA